MTITVSSGSTAIGLVVSSGDPLVVLSDGEVEFTTLLSGGSATLSSGSLGFFLTVEAGGTLTGSAYLGGDNDVFGSIGGMTLESGYLTVCSGGTANDMTIVLESVLQVDSGGAAYNTDLQSGNSEIIYAGGAGGGGITESGASLYLDGGSATLMTVLSGGTLALGGSLRSNLTVSSGALQTVEVLSGVAVSSGGFIEVLGGTVESGVTLTVSSGAVVSGFAVVKGGAATGSGSATGVIEVAGSIDGLSVVSAGDLTLLSGGTASGVTVVSGQIEVDAGASAAGTVVSSGAVAFVYSGGKTSGDVLSSGGRELVSSGGVASGLQVLGGGLEYVFASGVVTATTVSSGGKLIVSSGGTASAATLLSGGLEYVSSGGVDRHGVVSSGGKEIISSGGAALVVNLLYGGQLTDDGEVRFAGDGSLDGILLGSGTIVEDGSGALYLSDDGAKFGGGAVISSGEIQLEATGVLGSGYVQFVQPSTGSAVLQIDASADPAAGGFFSNVISNFNAAGEDIDLAIPYVAGASAYVTGSDLVLIDGGKTYKFGIAGTTAGAYPVLNDGDGGTLIDPIAATAPKAVDPKVVAFAHTAAAFAPSNAANAALVSSTSPGAATPFAHANSGGAGHF